MVVNRFLLASLNIDAILAEDTIHQRRQVLDKMTAGHGLQDAYDTTLDRIGKQGGSKSKRAKEALMWVSHSERPLKLEELRYALGVELGAEDFNMSNLPSIRTVLGCTLGLIAINETSSTVRLLHFTLHEYLGQHPTLFPTAHSMMAEICLTYLNSRSVRALRLSLDIFQLQTHSPALDDVLRLTPFLQYATCFWGTHAGKGMTEPVKSLALQLLDGYENHVSAAVLWRKKIYEGRRVQDIQGITGLHGIAFLEIAKIANTMLETKRWQVNGRDSWDRTLRRPIRTETATTLRH